MFHSLPNLYTTKNWTVDVYSTNSSIQWLPFVFSSTGALDLWRSRVIRIVGPANFRQIERAGVWPESPGSGSAEGEEGETG